MTPTFVSAIFVLMARRKRAEKPWQKKDTEALARELTRDPLIPRLVFVANVTCELCLGKGMFKKEPTSFPERCEKCVGFGKIARYVKVPFRGSWEFVDETLKGDRTS